MIVVVMMVVVVNTVVVMMMIVVVVMMMIVVMVMLVMMMMAVVVVVVIMIHQSISLFIQRKGQKGLYGTNNCPKYIKHNKTQLHIVHRLTDDISYAHFK